MSETFLYRREHFQHGDNSGTPRGQNTSYPINQNAPSVSRAIQITDAANYARNVTAAGQLIVSGNNLRKYLFVQNRGNQNIFVSFGSLALDSPNFYSAVLIPPNGYREWNFNTPVTDLYAITLSGTQMVSIEEGIMKQIYV